MLREIKESVDEGLENYKRQIVYQAVKDSSVLQQFSFDEGFYAIRTISEAEAASFRDVYTDTMLFMQDVDDEAPELEPTRMLTTVFEHNNRFYELQIINSMVEEDDLVKEIFREAIILYLILIICLIIINNVVLKKLWNPFYALLRQLKDYRIGATTTFPHIQTATKEFKDLQSAVNILLQHNTETYEQQKQFIGNASHELQTPLAIVTNKLELLIEKGNLANDQAATIADVMQIIERLVRINKSLLLLSKIENKQFLANKSVDIGQVVHRVVNDLEELTTFKNIAIKVEQQVPLITEMDVSLANVVVGNLLRNAIFHNIEDGEVHILISESNLMISNTGAAQAIAGEKMFLRFHKADNVSNGTGLGLAIVKAVCTLYGFHIQYRYLNNWHTFELRFG